MKNYRTIQSFEKEGWKIKRKKESNKTKGEKMFEPKIREQCGKLKAIEETKL